MEGDVSGLNNKQEMFAQSVVKNGGDKVQAYKDAGYSLNLNPNAMGVQADKLFNHPKISLRVSELQIEADKVARESFNISVEWRLRRLKDICDAGITTYKDVNCVDRYENLAASNTAIKTMNEMLGVNDSDEDSAGEPIQINFTVNPSVKEVKVIKGG